MTPVRCRDRDSDIPADSPPDGDPVARLNALRQRARAARFARSFERRVS
jgi:hypothetical protein